MYLISCKDPHGQASTTEEYSQLSQFMQLYTWVLCFINIHTIRHSVSSISMELGSYVSSRSIKLGVVFHQNLYNYVLCFIKISIQTPGIMLHQDPHSQVLYSIKINTIRCYVLSRSKQLEIIFHQHPYKYNQVLHFIKIHAISVVFHQYPCNQLLYFLSVYILMNHFIKIHKIMCCGFMSIA